MTPALGMLGFEELPPRDLRTAFVDIDFGFVPYREEASFTVNDANVRPASVIAAFLTADQPQRALDEVRVEELALRCVPDPGGAPTFTLHARSLHGPVHGPFRVHYVILE